MTMTASAPRMEKRHKGEYISNIIFNIIILIVLSRVPGWDLPFLKEHYMVVLTVLMFNCGIQAAGNLLMLIVPQKLTMYLIKILLEAASVAVGFVLVYLYPFNFSCSNMPWLDKVLPIIFIIGIVIGIIKIIVYIIKLIGLITEGCEER
jgi:hypothetical protein